MAMKKPVKIVATPEKIDEDKKLEIEEKSETEVLFNSKYL